jgi:hypothetical protein
LAPENRRQVAGPEPDEGVLPRTKVRHDDLADLAVADGRPGSRPHDLHDQSLVHDQAFACLRFVGDDAELRRRVALGRGDPVAFEEIPKRRRQRLAGDESRLQAGRVRAGLAPFPADLEKRRCPDATGRRC